MIVSITSLAKVVSSIRANETRLSVLVFLNKASSLVISVEFIDRHHEQRQSKGEQNHQMDRQAP